MLTFKEYSVQTSPKGNFSNINENFYYIFSNVKMKDMNVIEFDNYDEAVSFKENCEHIGKSASFCDGNGLVNLFKIAFGDNIFVNEIVISKHYRITD